MSCVTANLRQQSDHAVLASPISSPCMDLLLVLVWCRQLLCLWDVALLRVPCIPKQHAVAHKVVILTLLLL